MIKIWLFLILLSVRPGSERVVAVNAGEAVADMVHGDAARCLTGSLGVTIVYPAVGKLTTK